MYQVPAADSIIKQRSSAGEHFSALGNNADEKGTPPVSSSTPVQSSVQLHKPEDVADLTVVKSKSVTGSTADDDERRVKDILADPDMRSILLDNGVQQIIQMLRTDPGKAQM